MTRPTATYLTADDVRDQLRRAAEGNQAAWGAKHGISRAYINDCLHGRREPGQMILAALGLERVTMFRETGRAG